METKNNLHFILIPWLAQGHIIPMIDIARLLAARNITVSVITTPANLARMQPTISDSNLIRFVPLNFPSTQFNLPEGCENMDSLPSLSSITDFFAASKTLKHPLMCYLREPNTPAPSCIVSDFAQVWSMDVAREFGIPRIIFQGFSCFATLCHEKLIRERTYETVSDTETLVLPGLPQRIEITRSLLPRRFHSSPVLPLSKEHRAEVRASETSADGIIVNSFEELESTYKQLLENTTSKQVWMIGPVSTYTNNSVSRGNISSVNASECVQWLDTKPTNSILYVCFGSMGSFPTSQLKQLGLGLLASNHPFIWVIKSQEIDTWLDEHFSGSDNYMIIKGWAPQLTILSHTSVGGFLTHCGWNSSLEGICAGVPMATWPLFAEQFLNEKLLVEVLGVGVAVGVKKASEYAGELKDEVAVGEEDVARAVRRLMEGKEIRRRVKGFAEAAKIAVTEKGKSWLDLTRLIEFVKEGRKE